MGRDSALFKHLTQVDFEEIRQKGTREAKEVIDRVAETGLEYFLGGPHVLYKDAVTEFFNTATISDKKITATVCGTEIELTEASVAKSLCLPTAGQDATADIELKTFEAACQILSATKETIKVSGSKSTLKPEYIPICDIFARAILARGGNYSSLTKDKIRMLPAPGSTGGRKKATGKKAAPAKEKAESKGKEKVTFSEPPQQTEDEESASHSERTDTEKTDDERSTNEEEHSGQSPDNAGPDTNPETTEGGEDDGEEGGEEAGDEGGDKDNEEAEEAEADRVQLRKLTTRIRKITEKFEEVGPEDTLTPRVLERLEKAKGDLIQEIDRLEAMYSHREIPVYTAPRIETSPDHCPTPPRENAASEESDERADPLLTGKSPLTQPEVSESDFTKEWVESRLQRFEDSTTKRIDSRIQEFEDSAVQPFKERFQRIVCSALKFADTTRYLLDKTKERLSEIDEDQQEEAVLRSKYFKRTVILEDTTSELKENFGRLERETDQRLAEVAEDLINADAAVVEANAQAAKKVQDELDAEASKEKEAPRSSQLTEEEEESERLRRAEAKFPGLTKKAAAQAAKDVARLERERRRLEGFADDNKKKKGGLFCFSSD
ncbi:calponin homology domain-containing protein DDB_G0272472-like [Impatiens glandulifera]|uniref:calponin homology domain-containing protein DDB_G0272472-like n=1 Tax=Impatiens glandulifera TaxID=253017 RepID=UPI001FB14FA6|nr:calponin homology domain-containing protein DDB_G0272472-like [Impatiens glandulifera]